MRAEDAELLTGVGSGTPMGRLMRQYWIPALQSAELERDAAPVRLRLLGENLVAFRTSSGEVGLLDHRCPHRCASLFFGRNEDGGLRCVYHGWKFDARGHCLETPTEPPDSEIKNKVRAVAYPTRERGGIVWAYLGERTELPPLPQLEASLLPDDRRFLVSGLRECNWLQALEGDIDTAHLSFLHMGSFPAEMFPPTSPAYFFQKDRAPRFHVRETEYGTMYGAYRPGNDDQLYWRIAHFLFPFWTMPPGGPVDQHVIARAWVPLDDEHTMFWHLSPPLPDRPPVSLQDKQGRGLEGIHFRLQEFVPNSTDWLGRWRYAQNRGNDYGIDRNVQRHRSFTGIDGVHMQDQAITESMGPIVDRTREHLGSSDQMIMRTRRVLLKAARSFAETGAAPAGVDRPDIYHGVRSGEMLTVAGRDWLEAYDELRAGRPARATAPLQESASLVGDGGS
jgi:phenylpropionate dioxygenase-like ring-hydroxylating dioxygenase large terminal subunit